MVFHGLQDFAMDRQLPEWKLELDRIWSAHAPDYDEAVRLAQQIAASSEEETLRHAASQALPILRRAAHRDADHAMHDAARRRLGVIREVLSALTTPQFGRRAAPLKTLTAEERCRELFGLPLDRRLSESEIHRAYKLLAKRAHPDAGGNAEAFRKISAAHDVLMRERRMPPRYR
jgi:dTDP-4-amino-4,6-dideoxygalactose transaminase